jgi:hypothetical protein
MSAPEELTTVVDSCPQCGGARFYSYSPVAWSGQVCMCVRASPAPQAGVPVNQCDGCRRGLTLDRDLHRDVAGRVVMGCTAYLYAAPSADAGVREALVSAINRLNNIAEYAEGAVAVYADDALRHALTCIAQKARAALSPAAQQPTETKP